jgi:alpha-2-macroglobulin
MKSLSSSTITGFALWLGFTALMASPAMSQDTPALTFSERPNYFSDENPFCPDSSLLLIFNAPVNPADIAKQISFFDSREDRFVGLKATRPTAEEITAFDENQPGDTSLDHFVVVRPKSDLPLDATWKLYTKAGLSSADGSFQVNESFTTMLSDLDSFTISQIETENYFDQPLRIALRHTKAKLNKEFDEAKLAQLISVNPAPKNLGISTDHYNIYLEGDFSYGTEYEVKVDDGIIAADKTQLAQVASAKVTFEPNGGFITYPTFSTTQNASGHRRFEIHHGNLTGVRTRVKQLTGDQLILALREYGELYEGGGEKMTLPFDTVPGSIIHDSFIKSTAEVDHSETLSLAWDDLNKKSATGAYYLCSEGQSSVLEGSAYGAQSLVQLTDIGFYWKQSRDGTFLQTFSIASGAPLAGVKVRLVDGQAKELAAVVTDASGLANLPKAAYTGIDGVVYLDASLGDDRHVMTFYEDATNIYLWSFGIPQRYEEAIAGERRTLLFTDRGVYRPGDEVKIKGFSRLVDEDKLLGAPKGEARLRIYDSQHRELEERPLTISARGSIDASFTLPDGNLGWYTLELDCNPALAEGANPDEEETDWRLITSTSFQVEEYRVNTFAVELTAPEDQVGNNIEIPLQATYYMGKPLSSAEVNWSAYSYPSYPSPRGFDEFEFGDTTADRDTFSTSGTMPISAKGDALVAFELPDNSINPGPQSVSVTASVTDANQQTISGSTDFVIHSSDFYLGLRSPEGVHRAGDTATFSVAAVSGSGEAWTEVVPTQLLVEREVWNTVKILGANGVMTHRNERSLETVSDTAIELATKVDPVTGLTLALPHKISFPEAGDYLISAIARDSQNRRVLTRSSFTVIGAEEPSWSWHDVIRIDLIPDKTSYKIGDTAHLLARSPVFGPALLTTERAGVRSTRTLNIEAYETVIDIPIEAGAAPNFFASLVIFRGSADSPHVHTSADYRLGYAQIDVDDPASHLAVAIDAGAAEYYQPGEKVEINATVTDSAGKAVSDAEVTFYAVDEGVLSLTGYETPDPHAVFHAPFDLAVNTGQSLSDLLPENPLELDFGNKGYVIGGGGDGVMMDPDRMRKDFKALAFWEPNLVTDANGRVTASFVAPDNLTRFRIMAVVGEGTRFGQGEAALVVNKPLTIEPALPGFSNVTDQIDITAVLQNNTDKAQEIEVAVSLDDHAMFLSQIGEVVPTKLEPAAALSRERIIKAFLDPGATETLSFPVALTGTGEAIWKWQARSLTDDKLRDATESTLAIGYPLPLLREAHTFALRDGADLANALASVSPKVLSGSGEIQISLSNSRLIEASDALDYLLTYPYGCVEQTTSSLIPWLSTQSLRQVMPQLDKSEEEVAAVIKKGVARLFTMQTEDGGLAYWPGGTESVLWGSAYGGVGIAQAIKQGAVGSSPATDSLYAYLSKSLRDTAERKDPYELSQRCLAAYALALAGVNEAPYHEVLFEKRAQLSSEARALLALAMIESGNSTPERVAQLLVADERIPLAEVTWYKQPYLAATRLLAQIKHDPKSNQVDRYVDDLMKLRLPQRGWGSTYSNAWPLLALASYADLSATNLAANEVTLSLGDHTSKVNLPEEPGSGSASFTFDGDLGKSPLKISTKEGSPVYASMRIAARPPLGPTEKTNEGFTIDRQYQKVEIDGSIVAAENLKVGDLILVTLDLNIPLERETYLAIDDPLPAIFESVNPDFETQATQAINAEQKTRKLYCNFSELRKDRTLFFADNVWGAGDYSLQYLARVVAPGEVTAPPTKIEAMYEPQRHGLSASSRISAAALPLVSGKVAEN